jgi:hypothetical protein
MTFHRLRLFLLLAGLFFTTLAGAQDNAGGGAAGGAGGAGAGAGGAGAGGAGAAPGAGAGGNAPGAPGGASSSFGNQGTVPANPNLPNQPAQGTQGQGINPLPGQAPPNQVPGDNGTTPGGAGSTLPNTNNPPNPTPGSSSQFGNTDGQGGGASLHQAPPSFSVPGFYGHGAQDFTVGEGRLARPHFRISASTSEGYDDNVFQTPTHGFNTPAETLRVEVAPAIPASTREELIPSGDPNVAPSVEPVPVAGQPPKFKNVNIPAVPDARRLGSWDSRINVFSDMQFANRHSLFTFDIGGGVDYYWDRPGGHTDYSGNLALIYLRKLSGRAQFSININTSYQTQPDFSQASLPTSNLVGPYFVSNIKADLSYRLTPRFSTVTSLSYNGVNYEKQSPSNEDFGTTTIGEQLRYLFSPRMTFVGEVRYSTDTHTNNSALDNKNYYFLIGDEITLSKRFSTTLRIGEQVQTFSQSGDTQSAPFGEFNLNYRVGQATAVMWNARYGYEESGTPNGHDLVARTGLQLTQIFSPRLSASLSLNLIRSDVKSPAPTTTSTSTTTTTSTASTPTNPAAAAAAAELATPLEQIQSTIDATMGFYYTLDRHWSFSLTYTYTSGIGPIDIRDYYRQRLFFGATYLF